MAWTRTARSSALLVLSLLTAAAVAQDEAVVTTQYGAVRGVVEADHRVFYGIPHAAAPVGDLRWRSPVPPAAWDDVRDGTFRRDDCIQSDPDRRWFAETSEDCLYMNVWAPRYANATALPRLPVLVWFHGGGNTQGGTSLPIYNGRGLVQATDGGVVVVTASYRLNVFGFLGGEALRAEADDGAHGNYALQDQRAALLWVRDNIAAFGGDPSRVTIFGESAGSWDVQSHLVLPRSAGLFNAAVMESGASDFDFSQLSADEATANFNAFAADLGCADLACLRAIAAKDLGRLVSLGNYRWALTVDGVELAGRVSDLVIAGTFTRVPVIIGSNGDEVPAFAPRNLTEETYRTVVLALYGPQDGAALLQVYPASDYASPWFAFQQLLTDGVFTCVVRRNLVWMAPYTRMYPYYFAHTPGLVDLIAPSMGTFHGTEVAFVFHFDPLLSGDADEAVSTDAVAYWTNLAYTGDPNNGPQPVRLAWPYYDLPTDNNAHFVFEEPPRLQSNLKQAQCDVWDTMTDTVQRYRHRDGLWRHVHDVLQRTLDGAADA